MEITGMGRGSLSNHLNRLKDIKTEQAAGPAQPAKPGEPANIDKVAVSVLQKASISATPPKGNPQMYKLFSDEIEAAIEGIENIIRNSRFDEVTGGLMEGQRAGIINEPEKGISNKIKKQIVNDQQQYEAKKAQESSEKSIVSITKASLSSIIENVKQEQFSRNA